MLRSCRTVGFGFFSSADLLNTVLNGVSVARWKCEGRHRTPPCAIGFRRPALSCSEVRPPATWRRAYRSSARGRRNRTRPTRLRLSPEVIAARRARRSSGTAGAQASPTCFPAPHGIAHVVRAIEHRDEIMAPAGKVQDDACSKLTRWKRQRSWRRHERVDPTACDSQPQPTKREAG